MKLPRSIHRWNLSPGAAIRLQHKLAERVRSTPLPAPPRRVAGGDIAFLPDGERLVAAWVVWDVKTQAVVDEAYAVRPVRFPYVPGLLSFREIPGLLAAARRLRVEPDAFMLDGQGLAHPRRFGLACHFGVVTGKPSLGCAKSLLCGIHDTPANARGASKPLTLGGEIVGRAVRTQADVNPVYVSVGHLLTLENAVQTALRCCPRYRIPEPTRRADQLVTRLRGI